MIGTGLWSAFFIAVVLGVGPAFALVGWHAARRFGRRSLIAVWALGSVLMAALTGVVIEKLQIGPGVPLDWHFILLALLRILPMWLLGIGGASLVVAIDARRPAPEFSGWMALKALAAYVVGAVLYFSVRLHYT